MFCYYLEEVKHCKVIVKKSNPFLRSERMSDEKRKEIEQMLKEMKVGKSEDEIKKEYEKLFVRNNWETSSQAKVPQTENSTYRSLSDEKNPLVLLAEENGAFRALMKTIRMDLNQEDRVSLSMLKDSLERIQILSLHYDKMQKLIFPLLEKYEVENLSLYIDKEEDVLLLLKKIKVKNDASLSPFEYQDEIKEALDKMESNIVYENRFFFPVLEENMDEISLFELYLEERRMGFALIRV